MVFTDVRLGEGSVDQVICGRVLPLQEYLRLELVVLPKVIYLRVVQLQRIHVLGKLTLRVVPEDELADVAGKAFVQLIRDLFEVQFCHIIAPPT